MNDQADKPRPTHTHAGRPGLRFRIGECPVCNGQIGPWPEYAVNDPDAHACECDEGGEA